MQRSTPPPAKACTAGPPPSKSMISAAIPSASNSFCWIATTTGIDAIDCCAEAIRSAVAACAAPAHNAIALHAPNATPANRKVAHLRDRGADGLIRFIVRAVSIRQLGGKSRIAETEAALGVLP